MIIEDAEYQSQQLLCSHPTVDRKAHKLIRAWQETMNLQLKCFFVFYNTSNRSQHFQVHSFYAVTHFTHLEIISGDSLFRIFLNIATLLAMAL